MAFTLENLRDKVLTSIHGRRFGLDVDGFNVGSKGGRIPFAEATSDTTATELLNHGYNSVVTTTDDTWNLAQPTPGCEVKIGTGSSSTGTHTVALNGSTVVSTNGIASSAITLFGGGAHVGLVGITTAAWRITSLRDSSDSLSGAAVNFTS